jgi:SRSO17 transposase
LDPQAISQLGQRLQWFWERYTSCFHTETRDASPYALHYLSALLRLQTQRHFTAIGQVSAVSAQNIQHFMSNSPWDVRFLFWQIQREIARTPGLEAGGILLLDESADEKSSTNTVGAARQYNGRLGKVEMSQVGTFLTFYHPQAHLWTFVDGELFVPEACFAKDKASQRERMGLPKDRTFATKIELGWKMIQRVRRDGLEFEVLACDAFYGTANWFRAAMQQAGIVYMADIDATTRLAPHSQTREADLIWTASDIAEAKSTVWQQVSVRPTERGHLCDAFAAVRVFTWRDGQASQEWLVLRRNREGELSYALCNAPQTTPLSTLAAWKCARYFVERSIQDAKSELGFDELRAQKYLAWEHHLGLTALASWFIAQTKLDWAREYAPEGSLAQQLQLDVLPTLSVANVRALLRAVMPLPQLTTEEATRQVVRHLFNRAQSRKSRLKKGKSPPT